MNDQVNTTALTADELASAQKLVDVQTEDAKQLKMGLEALRWLNEKDYKASCILNNVRTILSNLVRSMRDQVKQSQEANG